MRRSAVLSIFWLGILFSIFSLNFPAIASSAGEPAVLRVVRITPTGTDVPAGRQIVFQFDRAVVPVGRMERNASEIPISISPGLNCQWRWLNTSALACQLDEKSSLAPATRYRITLDPGIQSEDGATLAQPLLHDFTTERPNVRHAWFKTWEAPGLPLIRMTFNQPVSQTSVADHVFMVVDGQAQQRIALNVKPDPNDKQPPLSLPLPGEKMTLMPDTANSSQAADTDRKKEGSTREIEARRVWLVSPDAELPLDRKIELKVEPGLVSFDGPQRGAENRVLVAFQTFPEFSFEGVECTDNTDKKITIPAAGAQLGPKGRCNPLRRAALVFSAPVIEEAVKDHVSIVPDLAGGRTVVLSLKHIGHPLPASSQLRVHWLDLELHRVRTAGFPLRQSSPRTNRPRCDAQHPCDREAFFP